MGVCLVTSLTDREWAEVTAPGSGPFFRTRNASRQLMKHPAPPMPRFPKPVYHDPAQPRTLDQVVAGLTKLQDRAFADQPSVKARVEGARQTWQTGAGYALTVSDGCFAYGVPSQANLDGKVLGKNARSLGRLDRAIWRDYAPVRPFGHAIHWRFDRDRVSWTANGQPDLGEGRSWASGAFDTLGAMILLADSYLWICRGRDWEVAITNDAILLTDPDGAGQLIVMGMC